MAILDIYFVKLYGKAKLPFSKGFNVRFDPKVRFDPLEHLKPISCDNYLGDFHTHAWNSAIHYAQDIGDSKQKSFETVWYTMTDYYASGYVLTDVGAIKAKFQEQFDVIFQDILKPLGLDPETYPADPEKWKTHLEKLIKWFDDQSLTL